MARTGSIADLVRDALRELPEGGPDLRLELVGHVSGKVWTSPSSPPTSRLGAIDLAET